MAKRNSASRQERRLRAREAQKQQEFDYRYGRQVRDRQNRIDDRLVELYTVCMGLAITDLYGYMPKRINRIVTQFCNRLMSLNDDGVSYATLRDELKQKTGVEFVWKRDEELHL